MPGYEVDSIDHVRPHTGPLTIQNAHTEQAHLLRHAKGSATDDAGHVRAMPIAVDAVVAILERVIDGDGTPAKFPVRGENTGIDDVGIHTRTIVVIRIETVKRQISLIDAVESP